MAVAMSRAVASLAEALLLTALVLPVAWPPPLAQKLGGVQTVLGQGSHFWVCSDSFGPGGAKVTLLGGGRLRGGIYHRTIRERDR